MGFNMYKQLDKIKVSLEARGFHKEIPVDIFGVELMLLFGMTRKRAGEWITNFETVGLIKRMGDNITIVKSGKK